MGKVAMITMLLFASGPGQTVARLEQTGFEYSVNCGTSAGALWKNKETSDGWNCIAFDTRVNIDPAGDVKGISFEAGDCQPNYRVVGLQYAGFNSATPVKSQPNTWDASTTSNFKWLEEKINNPAGYKYEDCAGPEACGNAIDFGWTVGSQSNDAQIHYRNQLRDWNVAGDVTGKTFSVIVEGDSVKWYIDSVLKRTETAIIGPRAGPIGSPLWPVALLHNTQTDSCSDKLAPIHSIKYLSALGVPFPVKATTCADSASGVAVTDADCGSGYRATGASTECSTTPCEVNTGSMADKGKCCEATTGNTTITAISPTSITAGIETVITLTGNVSAGDLAVWATDCASALPSLDPTDGVMTAITTENAKNASGVYKLCYRKSGKSDSVEQVGISLMVQAVCEASACSTGFHLKSTSGSLACASWNCTASDQTTCCDAPCKVPKVPYAVVSGAGCIAAATVVPGITCTVKAEAAGYECDATSMSCVNGNMKAPTCKLSEKDDDGKQDGREGVKDYTYKGSVSVTAGAANASQVEAAMRTALAKHFGCDESKVVISIKEDSPTALMVSFTIVLPSDAAKSTEAKMNALSKDMSGLSGDFIKQLQAAGVDTTNTKASSFVMRKKDNAAMISTVPTPVLGSATILAALWTMLG